MSDVVTGIDTNGVRAPRRPAVFRALSDLSPGVGPSLERDARPSRGTSVATSARRRSSSSTATGTTASSADPALLPERGTNADLALWIDRAGPRGTLLSRTTVFGALADDLIYWLRSLGGPSRAVNLTSARVYGLEQELRATLGRHLRLVGQGTITVAVDESDLAASHGKQIAHYPRYMAYGRPELTHLPLPAGLELAAYVDAALFAGTTTIPPTCAPIPSQRCSERASACSGRAAGCGRRSARSTWATCSDLGSLRPGRSPGARCSWRSPMTGPLAGGRRRPDFRNLLAIEKERTMRRLRVGLVLASVARVRDSAGRTAGVRAVPRRGRADPRCRGGRWRGRAGGGSERRTPPSAGAAGRAPASLLNTDTSYTPPASRSSIRTAASPRLTASIRTRPTAASPAHLHRRGVPVAAAAGRERRHRRSRQWRADHRQSVDVPVVRQVVVPERGPTSRPTCTTSSSSPTARPT